LIIGAVVELGGAGTFVRGHDLGIFKSEVPNVGSTMCLILVENLEKAVLSTGYIV